MFVVSFVDVDVVVDVVVHVDVTVDVDGLFLLVRSHLRRVTPEILLFSDGGQYNAPAP
jgi:hypothetical protein